MSLYGSAASRTPLHVFFLSATGAPRKTLSLNLRSFRQDLRQCHPYTTSADSAKTRSVIHRTCPFVLSFIAITSTRSPPISNSPNPLFPLQLSRFLLSNTPTHSHTWNLPLQPPLSPRSKKTNNKYGICVYSTAHLPCAFVLKENSISCLDTSCPLITKHFSCFAVGVWSAWRVGLYSSFFFSFLF